MNLLLSISSCEGEARRVQMFYTRNLGFHVNQHAILDSNLPICERVQDLLSRPILDEKVAMMIRLLVKHCQLPSRIPLRCFLTSMPCADISPARY